MNHEHPLPYPSHETEDLLRVRLYAARDMLNPVRTWWNLYYQSEGPDKKEAGEKAIALTKALREEYDALRPSYDVSSNPSDNIILLLIQQELDASEPNIDVV